MSISRTFVPIVLGLLLATAHAQVSFDVGGELAVRFGVDLRGRLPVAAVCAQLDGRGEVGSGFFPDADFLIELGACYDAAVQAGSQGGLPDDLEALLNPGGESALQLYLGRAYATLYMLGGVDISVGRQTVSWGSADALSPVDVVNPSDLRYPIAPPSERKLPATMLRAVVDASDGITLDFVLLPVFEPSRLPGPAWRPAVELPSFPPEAGVAGFLPLRDERPAASLRNLQFGVRATFDLDVYGGTDLSATYYRGFRSTPSASFELVAVDEVPGVLFLQPLLRYDRVHLLGVDFSSAIGPVVVRGEAALTLSDDRDGSDPAVGNTAVQAVLGAERTLPGNVFVSGQLVYEYLAAEQGGDASHDLASVMALRMQPDARLTFEAGWLHDWTDGSGLVQPSFGYVLADGVNARLDAVLIYGRDASKYGVWRDNSQFRLSLSYAF